MRYWYIVRLLHLTDSKNKLPLGMENVKKGLKYETGV